jgi:hypothetical protein
MPSRVRAVLVLGLVLTAIFVVCGTANASGQCYTSDEIHAEQLLRLHSELMVATVTCKTDSTGHDLVAFYTSFTRKNIDSLQHAEQTLVRYFEASRRGSGTDRLDSLRTKLGNEYGQKIANMSAPEFCQQYRDKVPLLYNSTTQQVEGEVQAMTVSEKAYGKLCPADASHIAKPGQ